MENDEAHFLVSELTLRDWFAGQALAGVMNKLEGQPDSPEHAAKLVADMSYIIADAMLAAREARK